MEPGILLVDMGNREGTSHVRITFELVVCTLDGEADALLYERYQYIHGNVVGF